MNRERSTLTPEVLLEEGDFVRALARSLLFDEHQADDVVQRTWLAALERPPRRAGAWRAWLRRVVHNFARDERRSAGRRTAREHRVAERDRVPSTGDIVEREAMRRVVVDAVLRLEEPYREVVVLRFFEGLPPRDVAARLDLPVETVRTRLKRALEKLRRALDRACGEDRSAWCLALVPLAVPRATGAAGGATASFAKGIALMSTMMKAAMVALGILVLCAIVAFWPRHDARQESAAQSTKPATASHAESTGPSNAVASEPAPAVSERAPASPTRAPLQFDVSGVVVAAVTGLPMAGLGLRLTHSATPPDVVELVTDGDGRFRSSRPLPPGEVTIAASEDAFGLFVNGRDRVLELARATITDHDVADLRIEYPWAGMVEGRVVDGNGDPVVGAEVSAVAHPLLANTVKIWVLNGALKARHVTTSADGRFAIERLPVDHAIAIAARAPGFAPIFSEAFLARTSRGEPEVVVRLFREARVVGSISEADGSPVAGARVVLPCHTAGMASPDGVESRADGTFELSAIGPGRYSLEAGLDGRRFESNVINPFDLAEGETKSFTFRPAAAPTHVISGTVVDPEGKPVVDVEVQAHPVESPWENVHGMTDARGAFSLAVHNGGRYRVFVWGHGGFSMSDPIEVLADTTGVRLIWSWPRVDVLVRVLDDATGEPLGDSDAWLLRSGDPHGLGGYFTADARGEYCQKQVRPGDYDVIAAKRGHAPALTTFEITPDEEGTRTIEVRLSHGRRVSGRVVDTEGRGTAGVSIAVVGGGAARFAPLKSTIVLSGPDGSFTLDSLPAHGGKVGAVNRWGVLWGTEVSADSDDVTIHLLRDFEK
ncbi:MAG: sigma-70 family RNA polymerase sigma factor [Planctomycetes bacterium]|nr:sigma-70 family RNA polymerase sigma factor [Planctomycetota bacterium]MBI3846402.1 sigma-70 family RNA polymerase sigma factor [Planctomycetota bacterium]